MHKLWSAEYLTIDEGLCVQIMHIGSFDNEPATVALMDAYLEQNGYVNDINKDRLHHEIYMSDARKAAPERWKTVIRHGNATAIFVILSKKERRCFAMNMADRIQHLRKSKGISQEELADKVGVSRQAVSKWESEQSTPDIEKVILLSNFFDVTTDYLLKGIEPITENGTERSDARIFSLVGSVFNFIGLVVAIMIWDKEQTSSSVAVGLILMAVGIMVFVIGQFIGDNKEKASFLFWIVNVWILILMPISCIFNFLQGIKFGYWWTFTPIPQLGNSIVSYVLCWGFYLMFCIVVDFLLIKHSKR